MLYSHEQHDCSAQRAIGQSNSRVVDSCMIHRNWIVREKIIMEWVKDSVGSRTCFEELRSIRQKTGYGKEDQSAVGELPDDRTMASDVEDFTPGRFSCGAEPR